MREWKELAELEGLHTNRFRYDRKDMTEAWAKLDHAVKAIRLRFAEGF